MVFILYQSGFELDEVSYFANFHSSLQWLRKIIETSSDIYRVTIDTHKSVKTYYILDTAQNNTTIYILTRHFLHVRWKTKIPQQNLERICA